MDTTSGAPIAGATVRLDVGQLAAATELTARSFSTSRTSGRQFEKIAGAEVRRISLIVEARPAMALGLPIIFISRTARIWRSGSGDRPFTRDYSCLPTAVSAYKPECPKPRREQGAQASDGGYLPILSRTETARCNGGYLPIVNKLTSCSAHNSEVTPPATIRIYDEPSNTVTIRDFKTYVKEVLPNEWFASWEMEALQAGAMAVRNFGWWATTHGPLRYAPNGQCYDVRSDDYSRAGEPGSAEPRTTEAVDSIWQAARIQ